MKRDIDKVFLQWKNSKVRQPLLVRGARQVGKSYSVSSLGKSHFDNCVLINFEESPEFIACFDSFDVKRMVDRISILSNSEITPGRTLLFLDEIQECPRAITALRYFYEKLPKLHVIAAGSLVEFTLKADGFRMPVGRIQSVYMRPISFGEFLDVSGHNKLRKYLGALSLSDRIEEVLHNKLTEILKTYLIVGGMPKIIDSYINNVGFDEIRNLQTGIAQTYQVDFGKYSATSKHRYLREVFTSAPRMVGSRYKYARVNPDIQSRDLKNALRLLADARCLSIACHSGGHGIPLEAEANEKKIKVVYLDVGLMQRAIGLDSRILLEKDIVTINAGSVAEQFVGQELISIGEPYEENKLFFWARDKKGSSAEVDYLVNIGPMVVPVEVKAGKTGTLKSMKSFLEEHPDSRFGIRFSMHEFSFHENVLSIPLYLIEQYERLANEI